MLPERHDQAGLLGQRHELRGKQTAATRVVPAHERLRGHDVAARKGDDRLVLDHHLAALDRLLQLFLEAMTLQHGVAHVEVEDLEPPLARLLRLVHREVGVADQLVRPAAVPRGRDPDAEVHRDRFVRGLDRLLKRAHDPLGDEHGVVVCVLALVDHHGEFVTAEPCDRVARADRVAQAVGDRDQ